MPSLPVALTGGLTITAGPSHLLDGALQLARFDFAPRDFDVEAPLLATTPADWTTACPPAYIGATPLRGALVVHVDAQLFSCSAESHARAAREHGAVGWLWWENAQVVLAYDPEPGILRHQWNPGDARALGVAAGDISQRPALPLIDALLDGHSGPIRARARPSVSQWEVRDGWPLALWSAVFALACATTFELAAARLVSFVRADGGVRASTSQLMLMLEMLLAVMRFASLVIDPWFSRGVYPARLAQAMATYAGPVVSVATSLFLAYFMSAADNSGFAVSNGRFRRLVINVGLLALVGDVTFTALVAWRRPPILVVLKIVWTVVALPIALLALSVATHLRVRARLSGLVSERIFARLISRLRLSIACSALSFALGLAAFWALYRPWRQLGVLGMASLANALTSYVRIDAFRAGFVNVPRGPIHRTARALARLGGARASYSARAHSSTTQRPSLMTHVEGATLATLPAAHEAGADAERSEWRADDSSRSRSLSIGTRAGLGARARASDGDAPDAFELPLPSVMRSPSLVELASSGAATPAKALRHRTPHNTRRRAITEAAVQPGLVDFEPHAPACTPPVIPRLAPRTPSITPTNPRRTPRAPTVTPVVPRRNEPARPPRASLGRTRSGGLLLASQLDAKLRALVAPSVFKNSQGHINDARAHLLLGVSLDFIQTLAQTESLGADTTTADVANIVREHTRASMRSLCEMTLGTVQAGRPLVGKATHFVSHAQSCSFLDLLAALELHAREHKLERHSGGLFFWIDVFSIRQHEVTTDVNYIAAIERSIGHVVMVLSPWYKPVCLSRMWCLYELSQTRPGQGIQLNLCMAPSEASAFRRALVKDPAAVDEALNHFDANTAMASVEADRLGILAAIEEMYAQSDEDEDGKREHACSTSSRNSRTARVAAVDGSTSARRRSSLGGKRVIAAPHATKTIARANAPTRVVGPDGAIERFNRSVRAALKVALASSSWDIVDGKSGFD